MDREEGEKASDLWGQLSAAPGNSGTHMGHRPQSCPSKVEGWGPRGWRAVLEGAELALPACPLQAEPREPALSTGLRKPADLHAWPWAGGGRWGLPPPTSSFSVLFTLVTAPPSILWQSRVILDTSLAQHIQTVSQSHWLRLRRTLRIRLLSPLFRALAASHRPFAGAPLPRLPPRSPLSHSALQQQEQPI